MGKDIVLSVRTLLRSPLFTAAAVLSLALGIGANAAIYSLMEQVVMRMLPVRQPERLVVLHTEYSAPGSSMSDNYESVFSNPMYRQLRDRDPGFDGVIARASARVTVNWQGSADPAGAEMVSGNFFSTLGVGAAAGRLLTAEDDGAPGAHPVVVLSHAYWSTHFAGSTAVLNQSIAINGLPMVVIGVAPAAFHGILPGQAPDLFVPLAMKRAVTPSWDALQDERVRWLNLFARLKPGMPVAKAQAATDVVYRSVLEGELVRMPGHWTERDRNEFLNHRATLLPAAQGINELRRQWEKPLAALMAMVGLVLLIACANVAGLMLARASARQREIAIRLAIGAGRWTIARQLLLEGLVLACAGALLGLVLAGWSVDALVRLLPGTTTGQWLSGSMDWRVLAFTAALAVGSGLLFALIPALKATRPDVASTLKNQAANVMQGGTARFRQAIVTAQVALSLLLLVGAGLFSSSLLNLMRVNLGFRTERLTMFSIDATQSRPDVARSVTFYQDLERRLAGLGEVSGVGAADSGPFSGSNRGGNLTVEGYHAAENEYTGASQVAVNSGFFRGLGIPLRAGREFSERDNAAAPKVVVVNEAFARRYFAGRDPVGHRLMFGSSNKPVLDREIVGVAADIRPVRDPAKETVFLPYTQWERPERLTYYVRSAGDGTRLGAAIRQAVREADANVPLRNLKAVTVAVEETVYTDRLIAMLSMAFGLLATLLAAIGLYGVVAYAVTRRTPEIGVRMALGARPGDVLRMVLKDAGRMVGLGIAIGLAGAFGLSRLVESQLFGVKAENPAIFAGAAGLLAAVALLAALAPGRRASRISPVTALKYE